MTEELGQRRAFVHRVNRGFARWFFQVSVPLEYLDPLLLGKVDDSVRDGQPVDVAKLIAEVLDQRLGAGVGNEAP